ncbi:NTP transferase domain-containing protein [Candidatus Micrarchaeota archaeon]|nr:NTP transferase domain-containing protein [Candidatus Micrarchaeota archaeon]
MERITITMVNELLDRIDELVKRGEAKNRSHAIGILIKQAFRKKALKKALILAGGRPEKLLLGKTMKPLIEVNGKTVLERILLHLKKYGVEEAVVCLGSGGEKIVSSIQGRDLGVKLDFLWEEKPLGSAGAMKHAQKFFDETFVLSWADVLCDELNLNDMLEFHRTNDALCTLALTNVQNPLDFGVAKLEGSRIINFAEKPSKTSSNLVNTGVAICEPRIFDFIAGGSFEKDLLPAIAAKGKLFGYLYYRPWFEMGHSSEEAKKFYASK